MVNQYQENKELIHAHLDGTADTMSNTSVFEMGISAFFIMFALVIMSWFIGLYLLIKYWNALPDWAKVVGTISFAFGYPIVTIVIVLGAVYSVPVPKVDTSVEAPTFKTKTFSFKRL